MQAIIYRNRHFIEIKKVIPDRRLINFQPGYGFVINKVTAQLHPIFKMLKIALDIKVKIIYLKL